MSTSPDVKKLITKEGALAYFKQFLNGDKGVASAEVLADIMLTVQHQARAPLVAELKNIAEADLRKWHKGYDTPVDFMRWAQSRARAALADTGKK